MNGGTVTLTILLGEYSVLVTTALVLFGVVVLRRQRDIRRGLQRLATRLRREKEQRLSEFKGLAQQAVAPDQAQEAANGLLQQEYTLYKQLLDAVAAQDGAALARLDEGIKQLGTAYVTLLQNTKPRPAAVEEGDDTLAKLQETIKELQEQNQSLQQDLLRLQHDMDETISEYASAFGGGHDGAEHVLQGANGEAAEPSPPTAADRSSAPEPPDTKRQPVPTEIAAAPAATMEDATAVAVDGAGEPPAPVATGDGSGVAPAATVRKVASLKPSSNNDDDIDAILETLDLDSFELNLDDDPKPSESGPG